MVFAHDTELCLQAAVELVNLDELSIASLDEFYERWGYTSPHDRSEAELAEVAALVPRLRAMLLAPRDEAVPLVNAMLAEAHALPQLVRHEPLDWHVHVAPPQAPFATWIAAESALAMVDVIRDDENSRLQVCADADCDDIVLDLSRNRSKRFCSVTCGNRNAVAAYRARSRN